MTTEPTDSELRMKLTLLIRGPQAKELDQYGWEFITDVCFKGRKDKKLTENQRTFAVRLITKTETKALARRRAKPKVRRR